MEVNMIKKFTKTIFYLIIAFDIWFAISYIEVVSKNLENNPLNYWNFFEIFLK